MISNEHPEVLERGRPDPIVHNQALKAVATLDAGTTMHVTSPAGTVLTVDITGAPSRGGGAIPGPDDKVAYWPAGLALCFPLTNSTNGTVVLDVGDLNLTFKRYIESLVTQLHGDHRRHPGRRGRAPRRRALIGPGGFLNHLT